MRIKYGKRNERMFRMNYQDFLKRVIPFHLNPKSRTESHRRRKAFIYCYENGVPIEGSIEKQKEELEKVGKEKKSGERTKTGRKRKKKTDVMMKKQDIEEWLDNLRNDPSPENEIRIEVLEIILGLNVAI